jgi:hypothetical protein
MTLQFTILSIMQKRDKRLLSVILSLITAFYGVFLTARHKMSVKGASWGPTLCANLVTCFDPTA